MANRQIIVSLLVHLVILFSVHIAYSLFIGRQIIPDTCQLTNWDARHYLTIITRGYYYDPDFQSNVAFFPGFPYFWQLTGLGLYGISIVNLLLFYTGMFVLAREFRFSWQEIMLSMSVPSMFFMYVPYSEALFFVFSILILFGLRRNSLYMVIAGLLLCSFTRSAANVFLPAIFMMEFMGEKKHPVRNIILFSISALLGVFIVYAIHYAQTGAWFGSLQTQRHWAHELRLPTLPFSTWGNMLFLDAGALAFGVICFLTVVAAFYDFFFLGKRETDKAFFFSALCLTGLTLVSLLFKGGLFYSLNRYLFPSAFFVVFWPGFLNRVTFSGKVLLFLFLGSLIFWHLFHGFTHIRLFVRFFLLTAYMFCFFLTRYPNTYVRKAAFLTAYAGGIYLQVYLFDQWIAAEWVG